MNDEARADELEATANVLLEMAAELRGGKKPHRPGPKPKPVRPKPVDPAPSPPPPTPEPQPDPRPPAPLLAVNLPDRRVGAREAVVESQGVDEFHVAVFEDDPARGWPWRGSTGPHRADPSGITEVPVTLVAPGDKVKVFTAGFTVTQDTAEGAIADPGQPAPGPAPAPEPGAGRAQARAMLNRMGLGNNQERFTVFDSGAQTAEYYRRYLDMGLRQIRFFPPIGEDWYKGGWGENDVRPWFDATEACIASGIPVTHLDLMGVVGNWQMGGDFPAAVDRYLEMAARLVAARGWPTDRFIVGSTNEYGGTAPNEWWQPHRFRWNGILRNALPNHTLVEGPTCWKDPRPLFDPAFVAYDGKATGRYVPWPDDNTMQDVHHYLGWDVKGMVWVAEQLLAWGEREGRPVFVGEWGFDAAHSAQAGNPSEWMRRFDAEHRDPAVMRVRPFLWCTTGGSAWRWNEPGTNRARSDHPGFDTSIRAWAQNINVALGHIV